MFWVVWGIRNNGFFLVNVYGFFFMCFICFGDKLVKGIKFVEFLFFSILYFGGENKYKIYIMLSVVRVMKKK